VNPSPSQPFAGVFPIAPTPFTESAEVDVDGQRRVLDCMVDQGVDGICILANYPNSFCSPMRSATLWSRFASRTLAAAYR
jgi:hypothetical protein